MSPSGFRGYHICAFPASLQQAKSFSTFSEDENGSTMDVFHLARQIDHEKFLSLHENSKTKKDNYNL
jgi:hypothetical protein